MKIKVQLTKEGARTVESGKMNNMHKLRNVVRIHLYKSSMFVNHLPDYVPSYKPEELYLALIELHCMGQVKFRLHDDN